MTSINIDPDERITVANTVLDAFRCCAKSEGCVKCNHCLLSTMIVSVGGKCCDVCDVLYLARKETFK